MKNNQCVNNVIRAIGNKENQDNFENVLLSGFESYFPGAVEVICEDSLDVYVNDIPLVEEIVSYVNDEVEDGESLLGVNWIAEYANENNYVKQVIPFSINNGQRQYVCPESRGELS